MNRQVECKNVKMSYVKLLSQIIKTGTILTHGNPNSRWITQILTAVRLFKGNQELVYDALLLVCPLKAKYHRAYSIILKHVLDNEEECISEPLVFMKVILLFRRLKALYKKEHKSTEITYMAARLKPPSNLISWLMSLDIKCLCGLGSVSKKLMKNNLSGIFLNKIKDVALSNYLIQTDKNKTLNQQNTEESSDLFIIDSSSVTQSYINSSEDDLIISGDEMQSVESVVPISKKSISKSLQKNKNTKINKEHPKESTTIPNTSNKSKCRNLSKKSKNKHLMNQEHSKKTNVDNKVVIPKEILDIDPVYVPISGESNISKNSSKNLKELKKHTTIKESHLNLSKILNEAVASDDIQDAEPACDFAFVESIIENPSKMSKIKKKKKVTKKNNRQESHLNINESVASDDIQYTEPSCVSTSVKSITENPSNLFKKSKKCKATNKGISQESNVDASESIIEIFTLDDMQDTEPSCVPTSVENIKNSSKLSKKKKRKANNKNTRQEVYLNANESVGPDDMQDTEITCVFTPGKNIIDNSSNLSKKCKKRKATNKDICQESNVNSNESINKMLFSGDMQDTGASNVSTFVENDFKNLSKLSKKRKKQRTANKNCEQGSCLNMNESVASGNMQDTKPAYVPTSVENVIENASNLPRKCKKLKMTNKGTSQERNMNANKFQTKFVTHDSAVRIDNSDGTKTQIALNTDQTTKSIINSSIVNDKSSIANNSKNTEIEVINVSDNDSFMQPISSIPGDSSKRSAVISENKIISIDTYEASGVSTNKISKASRQKDLKIQKGVSKSSRIVSSKISEDLCSVPENEANKTSSHLSAATTKEIKFIDQAIQTSDISIETLGEDENMKASKRKASKNIDSIFPCSQKKMVKIMHHDKYVSCNLYKSLIEMPLHESSSSNKFTNQTLNKSLKPVKNSEEELNKTSEIILLKCDNNLVEKASENENKSLSCCDIRVIEIDSSSEDISSTSLSSNIIIAKEIEVSSKEEIVETFISGLSDDDSVKCLGESPNVASPQTENNDNKTIQSDTLSFENKLHEHDSKSATTLDSSCNSLEIGSFSPKSVCHEIKKPETSLDYMEQSYVEKSIKTQSSLQKEMCKSPVCDVPANSCQSMQSVTHRVTKLNYEENCRTEENIKTFLPEKEIIESSISGCINDNSLSKFITQEIKIPEASLNCEESSYIRKYSKTAPSPEKEKFESSCDDRDRSISLKSVYEESRQPNETVPNLSFQISISDGSRDNTMSSKSVAEEIKKPKASLTCEENSLIGNNSTTVPSPVKKINKSCDDPAALFSSKSISEPRQLEENLKSKKESCIKGDTKNVCSEKEKNESSIPDGPSDNSLSSKSVAQEIIKPKASLSCEENSYIGKGSKTVPLPENEICESCDDPNKSFSSKPNCEEPRQLEENLKSKKESCIKGDTKIVCSEKEKNESSISDGPSDNSLSSKSVAQEIIKPKASLSCEENSYIGKGSKTVPLPEKEICESCDDPDKSFSLKPICEEPRQLEENLKSKKESCIKGDTKNVCSKTEKSESSISDGLSDNSLPLKSVAQEITKSKASLSCKENVYIRESDKAVSSLEKEKCESGDDPAALFSSKSICEEPRQLEENLKSKQESCIKGDTKNVCSETEKSKSSISDDPSDNYLPSKPVAQEIANPKASLSCEENVCIGESSKDVSSLEKETFESCDDPNVSFSSKYVCENPRQPEENVKSEKDLSIKEIVKNVFSPEKEKCESTVWDGLGDNSLSSKSVAQEIINAKASLSCEENFIIGKKSIAVPSPEEKNCESCDDPAVSFSSKSICEEPRQPKENVKSEKDPCIKVNITSVSSPEKEKCESTICDGLGDNSLSSKSVAQEIIKPKASLSCEENFIVGKKSIAVPSPEGKNCESCDDPAVSFSSKSICEEPRQPEENVKSEKDSCMKVNIKNVSSLEKEKCESVVITVSSLEKEKCESCDNPDNSMFSKLITQELEKSKDSKNSKKEYCIEENVKSLSSPEKEKYESSLCVALDKSPLSSKCVSLETRKSERSLDKEKQSSVVVNIGAEPSFEKEKSGSKSEQLLNEQAYINQHMIPEEILLCSVNPTNSSISILNNAVQEDPKKGVLLKKLNLKRKHLDDSYSEICSQEKNDSAVVNSLLINKSLESFNELISRSDNNEQSVLLDSQNKDKNIPSNDSKMAIISTDVFSSPVKTHVILQIADSEKSVKNEAEVLGINIKDFDSKTLTHSSCDESKLNSDKFETKCLDKKSKFLLVNSSIDSLCDVFQVIDDSECVTDSDECKDVTLNNKVCEINTTLKHGVQSETCEAKSVECTNESTNILESKDSKNDILSNEVLESNITLSDKGKSNALKSEIGKYIEDVYKKFDSSMSVNDKNSHLSITVSDLNIAVNDTIKSSISDLKITECIDKVSKNSDGIETIESEKTKDNVKSNVVCEFKTILDNTEKCNASELETTGCIDIVSKDPVDNKNVKDKVSYSSDNELNITFSDKAKIKISKHMSADCISGVSENSEHHEIGMESENFKDVASNCVKSDVVKSTPSKPEIRECIDNAISDNFVNEHTGILSDNKEREFPVFDAINFKCFVKVPRIPTKLLAHITNTENSEVKAAFSDDLKNEALIIDDVCNKCIDEVSKSVEESNVKISNKETTDITLTYTDTFSESPKSEVPCTEYIDPSEKPDESKDCISGDVVKVYSTQKQTVSVEALCPNEAPLKSGELKETDVNATVCDKMQTRSLTAVICIKRIDQVSQKDNISNDSDYECIINNDIKSKSPKSQDTYTENNDEIAQKLGDKSLHEVLPCKELESVSSTNSDVNVSNESQTCKEFSSNKASVIEKTNVNLDTKTENESIKDNEHGCSSNFNNILSLENSLSKTSVKTALSDHFPSCESRNYLTFSDISLGNKESNIIDSGLKTPNQIQNFSNAATAEIFSSYRNDLSLSEDIVSTGPCSKDDASSYCPDLSDDEIPEKLSSDESSNESIVEVENQPEEEADNILEGFFDDSQCLDNTVVVNDKGLAVTEKEAEIDTDNFCISSSGENKDSVDKGSGFIPNSENIEKLPIKEKSPEKVGYSLHEKSKAENISNEYPLTNISPENCEKEWDLPETELIEKNDLRIEMCSDEKDKSPIENVGDLSKTPDYSLTKNTPRKSLVRKSKAKKSSLCNTYSRRYSLRQKSKACTDDSSKLGIDISQLYLDSPSSQRNVKENPNKNNIVAKLLAYESEHSDKSNDKNYLTSTTKRETRSSVSQTSKEEPSLNTLSYNLRGRKSIINPAKLNL